MHRIRLGRILAKQETGTVSTEVESTAVSITVQGHLIKKNMRMAVKNNDRREGALPIRITAVKKVAAPTRVRKLKDSKKIS